jgi:fumarate reductase subunit D
MAKRSNEPLLWVLFSAGGVVAALLIPVNLFLFCLAFPLGWIDAPSYETLLSLIQNPLGKLYLLVLCTLPLFHWAHRFRYTLYDGLQIKHLNELVNTFCYGGAIVGTAVAAYLIWRIP